MALLNKLDIGDALTDKELDTAIKSLRAAYNALLELNYVRYDLTRNDILNKLLICELYRESRQSRKR